MRAGADLLVRGQVVVAATSAGLQTAEAVGIAGERVVAAGAWNDVRATAASGARVVDVRDMAVIPGLHDFHVHLAALARARQEVALDDASDAREIAARLARVAASQPADAWIAGRGWTEAALGRGGGTATLADAVGARSAFLRSHDGHSAWASPAALRAVGVDGSTVDPAGGRIERGTDGAPTGVLRETALELVAHRVPRLQGASLREPLETTLRELAALGITGASEAGDYTDENGIGADAALGDSYSSLTDLAGLVEGRLRLTLGIPADAINAARARGLRTGAWLPGRTTLRFGWAKEYADGALGSGTAALLAPRSCGERDAGILRLAPEELDVLFAAARAAGIGMAVHAIGDRAARSVLDAVERAGAPADATPRDRIEHAQLVHAGDAPRFGRLGVTASVQPIHAAADRDLVEACWDGRQDDAYAWRRLVSGGALLAAGSDAPVESVDPWLGLFAAVHRRLPDDPRGDWRPAQGLAMAEALAAYTTGPARAIGAPDEGHLQAGARADLAVLTIGLEALLAADEPLATARSALTLVGGREVDGP